VTFFPRRAIIKYIQIIRLKGYRPTLTWLNDFEARKISGQLAYRLLEVDSVLSFGDSKMENMLIQYDNLKHSTWLTMMYSHLRMLHNLLAGDNSIGVLTMTRSINRPDFAGRPSSMSCCT